MRWVGVFRRSIAAVPPWWDGDAEQFESLNHALAVFTRRTGGQRPVNPPLRMGWDVWGNPHVMPFTHPWLSSGVDKSATLELVPLTPDTTLGTVMQAARERRVYVVRLNALGHAIITKPEASS